MSFTRGVRLSVAAVVLSMTALSSPSSVFSARKPPPIKRDASTTTTSVMPTTSDASSPVITSTTTVVATTTPQPVAVSTTVVVAPTSVPQVSTTTTTAEAAIAPATTTSTTAIPSTTSAPSVYWGAYMDGDQTYNVYYKNERSWTDAPWDQTTWNRFEQNAGKQVSLLHYGQPPPWEQDFMVSVADGITQRGALPLMDMSSKSASLQDVAAGVFDSSIRAWATAVRAWGKPMFLRWNWEMNGTWFPWGAQSVANPAVFVDSWRRVHDVVAAAGADVTWVWCPNVEPASGVSLAQLYPGDDYVDWTCLDGYNWGTPWQSFRDIFAGSYDELLRVAPAKPIMIAETGSVEVGGSKSAWISDMFASLPQLPAIRALVWFNWRILERNAWQEWPVESSSSALQAFRQGVASGNFVGAQFVNGSKGKIGPPP